MKKFLIMIMLFAVTVVSAQTVHKSKAFDNTYVSVNAGVINPTSSWQGVQNVRPQFGIEVGKSLTTLYTMGIEFKSAVNTTGVHTAFDQMSLNWLHKLNVTNAIWGYCSDPAWDINAVGGIGWGHDMCIADNYGVVQAGIEVAYNFNETWSILAKPNIEWYHLNEGLNVNKSNVGLSVGVAYKFPQRGFTFCEEDLLHAECDRLNDRINDMRVQLNNQKAKTARLHRAIREHKCKVDTVIINNSVTPTVGFVVNSADVTSESYLYQVAKVHSDSKIVVHGYADKNTGTPEYNMELSKKRAETVKDILVKHGCKNVTVEAHGSEVQPFEENDLNRTVIIEIVED